MAKKIIRFGLSEREVDKALKELAQYRKDILRKTNLLREEITKRIAEQAQVGFAGAIVDDLLKGGGRPAEVAVTVNDRQGISVIIASGEDAIWVEFGAGVHHNGSAGTSPHPSGSALGFTIGGYDKGMGERDTWGFYQEGELRLTHGTPAAMPLYKAVKTTCEGIAEIAQGVFG